MLLFLIPRGQPHQAFIQKGEYAIVINELSANNHKTLSGFQFSDSIITKLSSHILYPSNIE